MSTIKTVNGLAVASMKTRNGLARASIKTIGGVDVPHGSTPFGGLVDTTNLVEWWPLSETSGTRVGVHAGLNLTDNNTVTGAAGNNGSSASQFTAANSEYLSRASESALNVGDIDFSFTLWAYGDAWARQALFSKWTAGVGGQLAYFLEYQNGVPAFVFLVSSTGSDAVAVQATTFGAASTGNWYFIYCQHDSVGNTIGISVNNGTLNTTAHSAGVFSGSTTAFEVGRSGSSIPRYMDGRMQRFGFFKRLLTPTERTVLYNSGNGLSY